MYISKKNENITKTTNETDAFCALKTKLNNLYNSVTTMRTDANVAS